MVVHAFVAPKLDYCNYLRYGLPKFLIAKLQSIQNSAARLVCNCMTRKFDHITPTLIDLHWLPIRHRIVFKILRLVYKSLNAKARRICLIFWLIVGARILWNRLVMEIDRLQYVPLDYGTLCLFQYVGNHLLTFSKKNFKMFISECL